MCAFFSPPRLSPIQAGISRAFAVHQTDIIQRIHRGFDLADYLSNDLGLPRREPWSHKVRPSRFWDIDRLQDVRWDEEGAARFDNSRGQLP